MKLRTITLFFGTVYLADGTSASLHIRATPSIPFSIAGRRNGH